jgi:hypothetical protein
VALSTATVGFGDIVLDAELISIVDIFRFSALFLAGFTLLSSFLGKFAEALMVILLAGRKQTLVDRILSHLESTDLIHGPHVLSDMVDMISPAATVSDPVSVGQREVQ